MAQALRLCGIDEYDVPITAGLSLGEGTGAVLGVILLKTMMYAVWHMATLDGINQEAKIAMINAKEMHSMDDVTREKARAVFARLG